MNFLCLGSFAVGSFTQMCGCFCLMFSFRHPSTSRYRSESTHSLGGRKSTRIGPSTSQKTVNISLQTDLCLRTFCGLNPGDPLGSHSQLDCFELISFRETHVSSPVITQAKMEGSSLTKSRLEWEMLRQHASCSVVKSLGMSLGVIFDILKFFFKM